MKHYVVTCWISSYGENQDKTVIKVFTDKYEADKFCAEKNETASTKKEYEESFFVEEEEE
jgi:hypothetical protein